MNGTGNGLGRVARRVAWGVGIAGVLGAGVVGCSSSGGRTAPKETASGQYAFWPLPPDEPRIQFIRSFRTSEDLREAKRGGLAELVFGEEDEKAAVVQKPYGVEMRHGKIYVCDIRRPALTVFDLQKNELRLIGTTGVNRVSHPVDVAVADDGMIYVADNERDAVLVFDTNERYARAFGGGGMKPVSLAVHGDRLYVCDIKGQNIHIMDRSTGSEIGVFGGAGDADGQFRVPLGVDVDKDGYVYVSDMMRCRVQKFSPDGELVGGFGELGDYAGSFARPKQMAVDSDGIIYVVDAAFQNVQMFNADDALLMSFGSAGDYPGAMNLPAGVAVSDEDVGLVAKSVHPGFEAYRYVVVTNQFGARKVNLYVLGRLREGYTVADLAPAATAVPVGVREGGAAPLQQPAGAVPDQEEPAAGGAGEGGG